VASLDLNRKEILLRKVGFEEVSSDDPFYVKFRCLNCRKEGFASTAATMMSLLGIIQFLKDHAMSCGEQPPVSPTGSPPTLPASPAAAVKTPLDQNDHPTDSGEGEGLLIGKPGVQFFVSNWDSKAAEATFQRFLKEYPIKETE